MSTLKLKEFIETCVCLQYVIEAESIHPSILRGLIPVSTPCFSDIDGNTATCKTIEIHMDVNIHEVSHKQLHIASNVVKKAIGSNFMYLYNVRIAEDVSGIKVFIRGA